ncbi:MAG: 2-hydroxyacid dehydrogenase [Fimbriimonadales bacterium]|nr:2-hydroxyacid dehydrogenase [Fimbriimonadales bacterium]
MLKVHGGGTWSESHQEALRRATRRFADWTFGDRPDPSTEVWVGSGFRGAVAAALPRLRAVVVPWAGPSRELIQEVRSTPGLSLHNLHHNAGATAEMAVALLLAVAKSVVPRDRALRQGDWGHRGRAASARLLQGGTALVLGYGAIGRRIARICRALGMRVAAVRRRRLPDDPQWVHGVGELGRLLRSADAVLCSLPLTPETEGLMGERELAALPPHAIVVNVGRGPVFDESALYRALAEGRIWGAGLDVWWNYPPGGDRGAPSSLPFHELENVAMTPHCGGWAEGIDTHRFRELARLLRRLSAGDWTANQVDLERGY